MVGNHGVATLSAATSARNAPDGGAVVPVEHHGEPRSPIRWAWLKGRPRRVVSRLIRWLSARRAWVTFHVSSMLAAPCVGWRVRRARAQTGSTAVHLVGVYRVRNAERIGSIVCDVVRRGGRVVLWGLDGLAPSLAEWTVGTGPGGKFSLLNRMLEAHPAAAEAWVVCTDDDIELKRGSVGSLAALAAVAGLDLAQPAHSWSSHLSHAFTRRCPSLVLRETRFVEIGPIFVISPGGRPHLLPFPDDGMGWGLELEWAAASAEGVRLGIVDAVSVKHLEPYARDYDDMDERRRVAEMERRSGRRLADLMVVISRWPVWRTSP